MSVCPLIDLFSYNPDTLNLNEDTEAKIYWVNCFQDLVNKISIQALKSNSSKDFNKDCKQRVDKFKNEYLKKLEELKNENKFNVSVRTLLDLNEELLRRNGFSDPWKEEKQLENNRSIKLLSERLKEIDNISDQNEKWIELFKGLLAGNMFDHGAVAVQKILEENEEFGLKDALLKIQKRPWLYDGIDKWLEKQKESPYHCAAIFADNSGVDIILGVLPFVRELLLRKTKVILCANAGPSLNDITYYELIDVVKKCCAECEVINEAYKNNNLMIYENGQHSCCLNFLTLSEDLCEAMVKYKTDLIILEGMGRALHTNLNAKFKCDSLKLAVIKNKWLANRLDGDIFSIICKYETVQK